MTLRKGLVDGDAPSERFSTSMFAELRGLAVAVALSTPWKKTRVRFGSPVDLSFVSASESVQESSVVVQCSSPEMGGCSPESLLEHHLLTVYGIGGVHSRSYQPTYPVLQDSPSVGIG